MKKIILFLFLVLTQAAFGQWKECNNGMNWSRVNSIYVVGTDIYAGVCSGRLQFSSDNGDNWIPKNNGLNCRDVNVILKSDSNLYVGTDNGIFRSTDGANYWTVSQENKESNRNPEIKSILSFGNMLYIAAWRAGIYRSEDKGKNWKFISGDIEANQIYSLASCGNFIYAGTWNDEIFISSDNGISWELSTESKFGYGAPSLTNIENSIFAGLGSGLVQTTDDGKNWIPKNNGLSDPVNSMVAIGNYYFASVQDSGVYVSLNSGDFWIPISDSLKTLETTSLAISGDYIFVGTGFNGIYRAKIQDLIDTAIIKNNYLKETIITIQPNPAKDYTHISLNKGLKAFSANSTITIYDLLGNEIKRFSGFDLERQTSISVITNLIKPGVYFCKYDSGTEQKTKSFIVLR